MADLARPSRRQGMSRGGLIEIADPGGTRQIPTYTCCHCNGVFTVPADTAEMGFCARCHARECLRCAKRLNGRCLPFETTLRRYEQRQAFLRAAGA